MTEKYHWLWSLTCLISCGFIKTSQTVCQPSGRHTSRQTTLYCDVVYHVVIHTPSHTHTHIQVVMFALLLCKYNFSIFSCSSFLCVCAQSSSSVYHSVKSVSLSVCWSVGLYVSLLVCLSVCLYPFTPSVDSK